VSAARCTGGTQTAAGEKGTRKNGNGQLGLQANLQTRHRFALREKKISSVVRRQRARRGLRATRTGVPIEAPEGQGAARRTAPASNRRRGWARQG